MHTDVDPSSRARPVRVPLEAPACEDEWVLLDVNVPESIPHRDAVDLLRLILLAFVARTRRQALVVANLACRWDSARPRIGVDPDVALLEPPPPEGPAATSLLTWLPGHAPPRFAIEVVSASKPRKDYEHAPAKYGSLGTSELVVFDPERLGPRSRGGPHVLQVWRRDDEAGVMTRVYAGDGPAHSDQLGAWLVATPDHRLRISDDAAGTKLWLTLQEAAQADLLTSVRTAVEDLCDAYGVPLDAARRAHLASLDVPGLEALRAAVRQRRSWPD